MLNPDFEIRLWRDADLRNLENQEWFEREPKMSGKADIARYEILRDHGGVYIDADFTVFRPFDSVIEIGAATGVVVARQARVIFNNAFIASTPKHPLMNNCVQGIPESLASFSIFGSVTSTGPLYLTQKVAEFVRIGGEVTELPQHWVYPYSYDRPDLANTAVSSETLMRHEWASIGDRWSTSMRNVDQVPLPKSVVNRVPRLLTALRLRNWKPTLARVPEVHTLRDRGFDVLASLWTGSTEGVRLARGDECPPNLNGLEIHSPKFPGPVHWELVRRIRRRIIGSATYVEVGLPDDRPWAFAARRLDQSGRAVRVAALCDGAPNCATTVVGHGLRGSLAIYFAERKDLAGGSRISSNGVPFVPRRLDRSKNLDRWDEQDYGWDLETLVESFPHIELLITWSGVDLGKARERIMAMASARRIGSLIVVIDPNSTRHDIDQYVGLFEELEQMGLPGSALGALSKQRVNSWRLQLRANRRIFAVEFVFDDQPVGVKHGK